MKFSYLDLLLVAVCVAGGYLGYRAGPLKKSITLLAVIVSLVLGFRLMSPIGAFLGRLGVLLPPFTSVLAFGLVSAALLAGALLLLRRFGRKSTAGIPGRIGASILGVTEAAIGLSFLLLLLKLFDVPSMTTRANSLLYRPLVNLAPRTFDQVRTFLPGSSEVDEEFGEPEKNGP
jgi:membrane protein required for colicin V production